MRQGGEGEEEEEEAVFATSKHKKKKKEKERRKKKLGEKAFKFSLSCFSLLTSNLFSSSSYQGRGRV